MLAETFSTKQMESEDNVRLNLVQSFWNESSPKQRIELGFPKVLRYFRRSYQNKFNE